MEEIRKLMREIAVEKDLGDVPIFINTVQQFEARPLTGWRRASGPEDEFYDIFGHDVTQCEESDWLP